MPTPTIETDDAPFPWRCPLCQRVLLTEHAGFEHRYGHIPAHVLRRFTANYPRVPAHLLVNMAFGHLLSDWHREHHDCCTQAAA